MQPRELSIHEENNQYKSSLRDLLIIFSFHGYYL